MSLCPHYALAQLHRDYSYFILFFYMHLVYDKQVYVKFMCHFIEPYHQHDQPYHLVQ